MMRNDYTYFLWLKENKNQLIDDFFSNFVCQKTFQEIINSVSPNDLDEIANMVYSIDKTYIIDIYKKDFDKYCLIKYKEKIK